MAEPQYLSTDPNAGMPASQAAYLSADPNAGDAAMTAPTSADMLMRRRVTSDAPQESSRLSDLIDMLHSAAHPQTLDDIGHLLMAEVDATRGLGTKVVGTVLDKLVAARTSLSKPADAIINAAVKRLGFDPEALDLAAVKMRLQAARSQTRQAKMANQIATARTEATPVSSAPPAEPVASAPVAPAPPAAAVARAAAPPPPSAVAPSALPDQKALNEAALAARRAAYQERFAKEAAQKAQAQAPTKFVPTKAEMDEYMRLIRAGKSHAEAGRAIVAQRALAARVSVMTPSEVDAEIAARGPGNRSPSNRR